MTIAIFIAFIALLIQALGAILGVAPVVADSNFTNAITSISNVFAVIDPIFPSTSVIAILQLVFIVESSILIFRVITWVGKMFKP